MTKADRFFELIQLLRRAKRPITADWLAGELEVTARTIYRDIATLQAMRVPIDGEAGIGYVMRRGYDLPPLMFSAEEQEAITVGLALLSRTGDRGLIKASKSVLAKIGEVVPDDAEGPPDGALMVSGWGIDEIANIDTEALRRAIRDQYKLHIVYFDAKGRNTRRTVLPIGVTYYVEVATLVAWCELRQDFRNFRLDRMAALTVTDESFHPHGNRLRREWRAQQGDG